MRRPNKPHRDGYENEEDCKEDARLQAIEDAMTPEEKARRAESRKGLRELY